jgi:hypothetical protein
MWSQRAALLNALYQHKKSSSICIQCLQWRHQVMQHNPSQTVSPTNQTCVPCSASHASHACWTSKYVSRRHQPCQRHGNTQSQSKAKLQIAVQPHSRVLVRHTHARDPCGAQQVAPASLRCHLHGPSQPRAQHAWRGAAQAWQPADVTQPAAAIWGARHAVAAHVHLQECRGDSQQGATHTQCWSRCGRLACLWPADGAEAMQEGSVRLHRLMTKKQLELVAGGAPSDPPPHTAHH